MPPRRHPWLTPGDARAVLMRRWATGEFLAQLVSGTDWQPLAVSLRPPTAAELAADFGGVQEWIETWRQPGAERWRIEFRSIGGRLIGVNAVPSKAWIDRCDDLWAVLGVRDAVGRFEDLVAATRATLPGRAELLTWMQDHAMTVLSHADVWPKLLAVVEWARSDRSAGRYLRQVDVPDADTKLIERHRTVLCELFDLVLPEERIDRAQPRSRFAARYGFAQKPQYIRLRRLDGRALLPGRSAAAESEPTELTMRVADLAAMPLPVRTVIVVENEITYLALPQVADAVAVHGSGYQASVLASIEWLHDRNLVYWGDIDTHGFRILHRLRSIFPNMRSVLMDRQTLLAHEAHWGVEEAPTRERLDALTDAEAHLYTDLIEGRYRPKLRLEQERIAFPLAEAALLELP